MDGLAQQMAGQGRGMGSGQGAGMGQPMPTVEEVIQLLMQGADPQELLDMGIPEELLLQALQVLQEAGGQAQGQAIPMGASDAGLAQSMV